MTPFISRLYNRYRGSVPLVTGSWYVIGTLADKVILFLGVPIFANLLTTDQFGTVSIFTTWMSIFTILLTLNVSSSVMNARVEFDNEVFRRFISSILLFALLICSLALVVFLILPESWIETIFDLNRPIILLAIVGAAFGVQHDVASAMWRSQYNHKLINLSKILLSAGSIILSVVLILVPQLIVPTYDASIGRILGTVLVNIVLGSILLRQRLTFRELRIEREHLAFALQISLPLVAHSISTLVLSRADQLLIDHFIGRSATGIYSLAYRLGDLSTVLWSSANGVWVVWFYNHMKKGDTALIRRYAHYYTLAFGGVTAVMMLAGPLLLRILAPPAYWPATNIVPVIMLGGFFTMLYSLYTNVEFYEKRTGMLAVVTVIAASVNIGLNILLLPRFGYSIAAWTTAASYACFFLFHAAVVIFRIRKGYLFNFLLLLLVAVALTAFAAFLYVTIG